MALPRIQYIDAGPALQQASISSATAPARALAEVGGAVEDMGQKMMRVAGEAREVKESGQISQFMLDSAKQSAAFQNELLTNQNYTKWGEQYEGLTQQRRGEIDALNLSPVAREKALAEYDAFAARQFIDISRTAATKDVVEGRAQMGNSWAHYNELGQYDEADHEMERMKASGRFAPSEIQKMEIEGGRLRETGEVKRQIMSDPRGARERLDSPEFREKTDPAELDHYEDMLAGQERKIAAATVMDFEDRKARGEPIKPENLKKIYPQARDGLIGRLKEQLSESITEAERQYRASPEYQNRVVGEAASSINSYNYQSSDFDTELADITNLIGQVEDPGQKKMLADRFNEVRDGQKSSLDSNAKLAEKALQEARDAGRFGDISQTGMASMSVRAAIDDRLLMDTEKLKRAGFSQDQADAIAEKKLEDSERVELFRKSFSLRQGHATSTPLEWAAYEALRNNEKNFSVRDPEAADKALQAKADVDTKYGAALVQIRAFAMANPKATKKDFEDEVYRIAGAETRKKMQEGMLTPKPDATPQNGPPGASNSTQAKPVGASLVDVVKNFEAGGAEGGFYPKAYWDYGQWSIGYGTKAKEGETVTKEEAAQRLNTELASHRKRVESAASAAGLQFTPQEMDALTSFDFNTGEVERLLAGGKRSKGQIADAMLLYRNATQGGQLKRLRGLELRRAAERELFLNGYPK